MRATSSATRPPGSKDFEAGTDQHLTLSLTPERCHRARLERDPNFDGRFFFAVTTTGIYCRPVCPARRARTANVRYFESAVAAATAGFRPCLRCRPEQAPSIPSAPGGLVSAALQQIDRGALDEGTVVELASSLNVGERRLRRVFRGSLGVSPARVANHRRLMLARQMLESSTTRVIDVAFASGFNSLRRFNEAFKGSFGVPPSALRRQCASAGGSDLALSLGLRRPFDGRGVLQFLAARAIPGVERVGCSENGPGEYERTFCLGDTSGVLNVTVDSLKEAPSLRVVLRFWRRPERLPNLLPLVERVKHLFDAVFDPAWLEGFKDDATLASAFAACPGIRVPGCFDPFELAVRAVLGQQVTVAGATTMAGRIAQRWGATLGEAGEERLQETDSGGAEAVHRLFPTAQVLADAPLEEIGLTRARAKTLRGLAHCCLKTVDLFDPNQDLDDFITRFCALPGIGPWTAHYVAMRALHARDAFPASDLVLRKALAPAGGGELPRVREVEQRSSAWRPFRAYAAMLLWRSQGPSLRTETES